MRKVMKSTLVIMLTLALILTQVSMVTYADNGKGNSNNNGKGNTVTIQNKVQVSEQAKLELREKLRIMVSFGQGNWEGIPEGMMKKGYLPYGLAKRYMNGDFPYGLAKRIKDFQLGQEKPPVDIEVLKALIVTAKAKADGKVAANYEPVTSLADFQKAITDAEAVSTKTAPTSAEIKTQIEKLKAAIVTFENNLKVDEAELVSLLTKLTIYKNTYEDQLTKVKLDTLKALMSDIDSYIKESSKVLTIKTYNEFVSRAKAFEDHMQNLKDYIAKIKAKLYVDPTDSTKGYKHVEGTDPEEYLVGSGDALKLALITAELFVANYNNEPVVKITAAMTALQNAEKSFDNNKILSLEEKNTLKLVRDELFAYYTNYYVAVTNPLTDLKKLIDKIDEHFATTPKPYTLGDRTYYFDLIPKYLSDIYTQVKAELVTLIAKADVMIGWSLTVEEAVAVASQKTTLVNERKDADDATKLTAPTYTQLNTAYKELDKAMVDFEKALEKFRLYLLIGVATTEKNAATLADQTTQLYINLVSEISSAQGVHDNASATVQNLKDAFSELKKDVDAFTPSPVTP